MLITVRILFDYIHIVASKLQTPLEDNELELTSFFFVMHPSADFWQSIIIIESIFSNIANMKIFQLAGKVAYHLMVFAPMVACIALDVLLVWARLILPYIIYLYFQRCQLFKEFIAEVLSFLLVVLIVVRSSECAIMPHIRTISTICDTNSKRS